MTVTSIFLFGKGKADGSSSMKDTLGGKGANLAGMSSLGVPVPPGFTIPCAASMDYLASEDRVAFMSSVMQDIAPGLKHLVTKKIMPLVSVRSGARVSMPGMMDTILNVGLTTSTLPLWIQRLGERAALDSYRRLIQMYASVAMGADMKAFEGLLSIARSKCGAETDADLTVEALQDLVVAYRTVVKDMTGQDFPDTLEAQLEGAISAVFSSWENPRAKEYRKINSIPDDWGTAVTIQAMVFGNLNDNSCTGVLFSRDPSTGANEITGEYLVNAQGEDVVAGIRTPEHISSLGGWNAKVEEELTTVVCQLEQHYTDMQDIEFTVEDGKLYILQTRNGKRSAQSAFKIARDLCKEGLIDKETAFSRISEDQLYTILRDRIEPGFSTPPDFSGIAAGGTIVTGVAVFTSDDAINCTEPCILVREETDPDDIGGMNAAVGILTATGGLTSHAAVVARGMNKTCVVGATSMHVDEKGFAQIGDKSFSKGVKISIDGMTGNVWINVEVPCIPGEITPEAVELLSWGFKTPTMARLTPPATLSYGDYEKALHDPSAALYVDTFYMAGNSMSLPLRKDTIELHLAILGKLLDVPGGPVLISLAPLGHVCGAVDTVHLSMFGPKATDGYHDTTYKVKAIMAWPETARSRAILATSQYSISSLGLQDELAASGIRQSGAPSTFADLLTMASVETPSPEVVSKVFGSMEAFKLALELVGKHKPENKPVVMPPARYWYEAFSKE